MGFTFVFSSSLEDYLAAGETACYLVQNNPVVAITLILGILIAIVTSVFFNCRKELS